MAEITQTVTPIGGTKAASPGAAANRPIVNQSFTPGENARAVVSKDGGGPTIEQTVSNGVRGGRMLSETTREMLANLDKHGSVKAPPAEPKPAEVEDSSQAAAGPDAAGAPPPVASPSGVPPAAAAAAPEPADDHKASAERYAAKNRDLVAEIDKLKAKPGRELSAREKALDAAERMYLDDPVAAIRHLIAVVHGIDDPKHKDVDSELSGLYQDLTARELGVPVDPTHQAQRESARTRQLLAREKREWKAERDAPPVAPEDKQRADHTQLIGNHLASRQTDGKTIGEAYPLTLKFSERLHGMKPEALVLAAIQEGFRTGEFDPKDQDHKLIEQAARKIETKYQDLAKLFDEARPSNSTATPTPTADATAKQDAGQKQAARPITNASASVAPATPPAKQPDKPAEENFSRKRPNETEHQRRLRIANRHLSD